MVKSVFSCCVRGSRVFSNPVTYIITTKHQKFVNYMVIYMYVFKCIKFMTEIYIQDIAIMLNF